MLSLKEFKKGIIVWWTTKHWDNPCIVTEVNHDNGTFKVFDLNEIRETSDILIGKPNCCSESALTEMRIPTDDEVLNYIDNKLEKRLTSEQYELLYNIMKFYYNPLLAIKNEV
jgi:hypothetical protein